MNCPKAQLIIIYGSPSANNDYPVEIKDNGTSEYGHAPKFIDVNERSITDTNLSGKVHRLCKALNLCLVDEFNESNPFNYYNINAFTGTDEGEDKEYIIFSTKLDNNKRVVDKHPNDDGYLMYSRYTAGRIISMFNRG